MVGSDPVELMRLGQEMVKAGDDLQRRRERLQRVIAGLDWTGPSATRLRRDFLAIKLGPLVDLLRREGAALREQAAQQAFASRAEGGIVMDLLETVIPPLFGAAGPAAPSSYTIEALRRAGINPATWKPELGFAANSGTIEKVYEYYGQLYLDHPELQWAGMAALIGPSFQAGFEDLSDFRTIAGSLADRLEEAEKLGAILPPGTEQQIAAFRALAGASEEELAFFETTLLDMQQQIFIDQATQHEAFLSGGLPAIRELRDSGVLDDRTVHAWELIERGRGGDAAALAEGNRLLLLREQTTVIDDEYQRMLNHDPPIGQAMTYLMTATGRPTIEGAGSYADIDPLTLSVSTPATIGTPESIFGQEIPSVSVGLPVQVVGTVETPLPAGNIANFDDRWRLIEQDTLPAYQELLEDGRVGPILTGSTVAQRAEEARLANRVDDLFVDLLTDWDTSVEIRTPP